MAKKVTKRQARGGPAGKARNRPRPAKEASSPPPTANGSPPVASANNGLLAEPTRDPLNQTTTYVNDGQNCLTRIEDPFQPLLSLSPDVNSPEARQKRSSRKRENGKTRIKRNNTQQKRKPG